MTGTLFPYWACMWLTEGHEGELEGLPAGDAAVAGGPQQRVGGGATVAHWEEVLGRGRRRE